MKNNDSIAERNRIVEEHLPLIDKVIRRNGALMKAGQYPPHGTFHHVCFRLVTPYRSNK